jgi:hypothetical protein
MRSHYLLVAILLLFGTSAYSYPDYYNISDHAQAQVEARERNLPLAWVGGFPDLLNTPNPEDGSQADLEQLAMKTLRDNAVIIFFDGHNMAPVPGIVHAQFHIHDDGDLPDGASWNVPKIVFTNPEVTKALGRVSATQLHSGRDGSIFIALQAIRDDPTAMLVPPPPPPHTQEPPTAADSDSDTTAPTDGYETRFGKLPLSPQMVDFLNQNRETLKWVAGGLVIFLVLIRMIRRNS